MTALVSREDWQTPYPDLQLSASMSGIVEFGSGGGTG
jgi:hypothetical protein